MEATKEKKKPEPIMAIVARTEITIEHGPQGYAAEFKMAGFTVLVRGVNAAETLAKTGQIIDDLAHVIRTYIEDASS